MAVLVWLIPKGSESSSHNDQCIARFIVGCPAVSSKHASISFFHFFRAIKKKKKKPNQTPTTQTSFTCWYVFVG